MSDMHEILLLCLVISLNQGNAPALFSSIKMVNKATLDKNLPVIPVPTVSQYLGTIAANLPLPFNIPLQAVPGEGNNNNIAALAAYPVSFQITYTDNLKIIHNLIINDTVSLLGIGPLIQKTAVTSNELQGSNAISISDPEQEQQPLPQLPFVDSYWAQNVAQTTVTNTGISTNGTALIGKSAFTRFNNPDFVKLAESFGAKGYDLKSSIELPKILEEAKELTEVPTVISVNIDYSRNRILIDDNFNG